VLYAECKRAEYYADLHVIENVLYLTDC